MKRYSRATAVLLGVTLLSLPCLFGCAIENSRLPGSETPIVRAYGRNAIVGVPTLVGNTVGLLVAAPAVVAFEMMDEPTSGCGSWVGWTAAGPVYLMGGLVGTPFLPLALLAPERRSCLACTGPE